MSMTMCVWAVDADQRSEVEQDLEAGRGLVSVHSAPSCSLEKAWHAIHFILTGTAYEGDLPAAFIIEGGDFLREPEDDVDCPPRWLDADLVDELNLLLQQIDDAELALRCDVPKMVMADIYSVSEECGEDLLEELADCFLALRTFVEAAASQQQALIVAG